MVGPARRETRFGTRSAFLFAPIQHCQRRWKRLRARSPGRMPTRKPRSSARRVAEAQIDLRRVRCARHQLLSNALSDPYYASHANVRMKMKFLGRLRAKAPDISMESVAKVVPQVPHRLATILSQEVRQLLAMDRYERRALSRRKFAIRAFDAARSRGATAGAARFNN